MRGSVVTEPMLPSGLHNSVVPLLRTGPCVCACVLRALPSNGFTCHNIDFIKVTSSFRTFQHHETEYTFPSLLHTKYVGKEKKKMKIKVLHDENPRSLVDCGVVRFILYHENGGFVFLPNFGKNLPN
jgi:hypothetical protein